MQHKIEMDEGDSLMLKLVQGIKKSPDYQKRFSEDTKRNFDLYERALCGDAEAVSELSISRGLYDTFDN